MISNQVTLGDSMDCQVPTIVISREDRQLLTRCSLGDSAAWEEFVRRCFPVVVSAAATAFVFIAGNLATAMLDGVERAAARGIELVLGDTAGRLHTKSNLMDELRKVRRVADKGRGLVTEVLLVIDATEGITGQDQRLAERVDAAGCPIVVLLNKWDLLDDADQRADITAQLADKLAFVGDSPVLKISAKSGKGVHKLLPVLQEAIEQYHKRVPTKDVNRVIASAQQKQPGPHGAKVMYALQGATDPPTFTLFVNKELPPAYVRYLERAIREAFGFGGTPIKLRFRKRAE